jgi:hypothetical protein
MNQTSLIRKTLQLHLNWHGARVTFLALFLVALMRLRTVNFSELAKGFMGTAQTESNQKRLHRFFRDFQLDYREIARLVAGLMEIPQPWVLSIDRTNWQFGSCVFNILMLGVVHQGVAFTLVWTMLDKKGNSNHNERITLMEEFREIFPDVAVDVDCITADREFIGEDWFSHLLNQVSMPFRIRIRHSDLLFDGRHRFNFKASLATSPLGSSKSSNADDGCGGTGFT